MSKLRVDEAQGVVIQSETTSTEQVRRRQELHTSNRYERQKATFAGIGKPDLSAIKQSSSAHQPAKADEASATAAFTCTLNGETVELPSLSADERARLAALLTQLPESRRVELQVACQRLARSLLSDDANGGSTDSDSKQALDVAVKVASAGLSGGDSADAIVFSTMDAAEDDVRSFVQGLADRVNVGNELRTDITELQGMLADWPDDGSTQKFSYREVVIGEDGKVTVIEHKNVELTKAEAAALLEKLKTQSESIASLSTTDQARLQYEVSRYREISDTLSNLLKNVDDTRKGIIGNIRA